jgi:hypothetical protein
MSPDQTFSEDLLDYIRDRDSDYESDLTATEREEHQELEKLTKATVSYVLASRESITGNLFKKFENIVRSGTRRTVSRRTLHQTNPR